MKTTKQQFQVNGFIIKWSNVYEKWHVKKNGLILEAFKEKKDAISFAKQN